MDHFNVCALEVRILSNMLSKLAGQDLERRLQERGADVSSLQFGVLRRLSRGSATISELSSNMVLAPATLVPVIDALERKGLLRRGHDPQDRRRKSLTLTEAGRALLTDLPSVTQEDAVVKCLAEMGSDKADQLVGLMRQLVASLTGDAEKLDHVLATARGALEAGGMVDAT